MTFQTLGLKTMHKPNKRIKPSLRNKIISLRKEGLSCNEIANLTGVGRSTIARYTSDWYQRHVTENNLTRLGQTPKYMKVKQDEKKAAPAKTAAKPTAAPKPTKAKEAKKPEPLSPEALEYIKKVYGEPQPTGNFVGNFFIRLGKFLGGHDSV